MPIPPRLVRLCLVIAAVPFHLCGAASRQWGGGDAEWNEASHWLPGGATLPANLDQAVVGGNHTVTLAAGVQPASGKFDALNVGGNQFSGVGNGTLVQTGGTVTSDWVRFGRGAGLAGTYNLSGGTLNATRMYVGGEHDPATGWALQTGGVLNVGDTGLYVGSASGGAGTLEIRDGQLTAGRMGIGVDKGVGRFLISGGTVNVTGGNGLAVGEITTAPSGQTRGTLRIEGGHLTVQSAAFLGKDTFMGTNTEGSLEVAGGAASFGSLLVGAISGSSGVVNQSGGTVRVAAGGTGLAGIANAAGSRGTWIVSGGVMDARTNLDVGPRTGSNGHLLLRENADVRAGSLRLNSANPGLAARARVDLDGGVLRVDNLVIATAATNLLWGSTTLALHTAVGADGTEDATVPGNATGPFVSHGRSLTVSDPGFAGGTPDLRTGSGVNASGTDPTRASVLDLGEIYVQAGVRHNRLLIQNGGNLDLSAAGDTLRLGGSCTPLRPAAGGDFGSLTLVLLEGGGGITGRFDTFVAPADDGLGFAPAAVPVTDPSQLAAGTYALEYRSDRILLHYHVTVPDPVIEPVQAAPEAITYRVAPGREVWLEETPSLNPAQWVRSSVPVRFEGQVAVWDPEVLETLVQTQRFFRVVIAPGP